MKKILGFISAAAMALSAIAGCTSTGGAEQPDERVFCFYYNWYGNPEHNGKDVHWAHGVIGNSSYTGPMDPIPGGDNVASNFYPQLGNYSSTDPQTIAKHVEMMAQARIGVIVVTWWGDNDFGTPGLKCLFDEAQKHLMADGARSLSGRIYAGSLTVMAAILHITDLTAGLVSSFMTHI